MSSSLQPIKVWGKGGPNPPKVHIILLELGLPCDIIPVPLGSIKTNTEYIAINPNGRVPSIQDPNTSLTLWESGAIINYFIQTYDTDHKLSFPQGTNEYWLCQQWLFFAASGQGPYFGQYGWFKIYHGERVPSAVERFAKEVGRVTGVLEGHLKKEGEKEGGEVGDGPWLVGGKCSFADLVFVPWMVVIALVTEKEEYNLDEFPHVKAWYEKMMKRESVKEAMASGKPEH